MIRQTQSRRALWGIIQPRVVLFMVPTGRGVIALRGEDMATDPSKKKAKNKLLAINRRALADAGLCRDCRLPAETERAFCRSCLDKYKARSKRIRDSRSSDEAEKARQKILLCNRTLRAKQIAAGAEKQRQKENPQRLIWKRLRSDVRASLLAGRQNKNSARAYTIGCTSVDLVKYIEGLWEPGMTWDNYGRNKGCWQIDHIVELSKVDLSTVAAQLRSNHYTNLRPIWQQENLARNANVTRKRYKKRTKEKLR